MSKPTFLKDSLKILNKITKQTYNIQTSSVALNLWKKHLHPDNPLWNFVTAKSFSNVSKNDSAHVLAMIDKRLPNIGLVGYFACSNSEIGSAVLKEAVSWLKNTHQIKNIYGPINGTATSDYRLNLSEDYQFPGEPVNPAFHIDAFDKADFKVFNRYVSGISKHYQLFMKLLLIRKPSLKYSHLKIRPFNKNSQIDNLRIYHNLMTNIFPSQSIYCPVLSWEERLYNNKDKNPIFDPKYTYFLEDGRQPVGLIASYPYNGLLIVKTLGLLSEYRGKHLSGLLLKKVHDQAKEDGLEAAVYAMVRVGNAAYKMGRPGVKIFRNYVTMHKNF